MPSKPILSDQEKKRIKDERKLISIDKKQFIEIMYLLNRNIGEETYKYIIDNKKLPKTFLEDFEIKKQVNETYEWYKKQIKKK